MTISLQSFSSINGNFGPISTSFNVGLPGNNRLLLVHIGIEYVTTPSTITNLFVGGVEVGFLRNLRRTTSKTNLTTYALDESLISSLSGNQTINYPGTTDGAVGMVIELYYGVESATPFEQVTATSSNNPISLPPLSSNDGGLISMPVVDSQWFNNSYSFTAPLIRNADFGIGQPRAWMSSAYVVEEIGKVDYVYSAFATTTSSNAGLAFGFSFNEASASSSSLSESVESKSVESLIVESIDI